MVINTIKVFDLTITLFIPLFIKSFLKISIAMNTYFRKLERCTEKEEKYITHVLTTKDNDIAQVCNETC